VSYSNPTRHRVTPDHTPTSEARVAGATHRIDHIAAGHGDPTPDDFDGPAWFESWVTIRDRFGDAADYESCHRAYLAAFLRESIR
jgi:hypothetical protein